MVRSSDAELVLVGNELLNGERQDDHLWYLSRLLRRVGVQLGACHVVRDDKGDIERIVRERSRSVRMLLVCGGLGPTEDDVTREAIARGIGEPLEFSESAWKSIESFFASRGFHISETNRRQAFFPRGASPIPNRRGTAPAFSIEKDGCLIIALPGPPLELADIVETSVLPMLSSVFGRQPLFMETFRTTGIGESTLASILEDVFRRYEEFAFSSLPYPGGVDLVMVERPGVYERSHLEQRAAAFEREFKQLLRYKFYGKGTTSLEEVIGESLAEKSMTLSIAESLTGGHIGKCITDVPGSSRYFLADVVAYSNDAKVRFLGVSKASIERWGAVSEAVCAEMARGIRERTGATWGLATTGIAGPAGGTDEKPVGLCFYGLCWEGGEAIKKAIFGSDRETIRERVARASLYMLLEKLEQG